MQQGKETVIKYADEFVVKYLDNLYNKIHDSDERRGLYRWDEERVKIDNFLDCIEHVINYIEKGGTGC